MRPASAPFHGSPSASGAALPFAIAVAAAALWPLSAYVAGPLLFPAVALVAAAAATVVLRPAWGIALVAALAPLTNLALGGGIKPFQLLLPALSVGLVAHGLLLRRRGAAADTPIRAGGVAIALAGLLLAGTISSIGAIEPGETVTKIGVLVAASALAMAVLVVCGTRADLLVVTGGVIAGLGIASAQGVGEFLTQSFDYYAPTDAGPAIGRVQGSFGHPNQYAGYLAMLMPLAAVVAATRTLPGGLRALAGSSLVLAVPAIMLAYSRGAIVACILGSLLWFALIRPRAAIAVAVVAGVIALVAVPSALRERFTASDTGGDVSLRSDVWRAALDIYADQPLFGAGLNNFGAAYKMLPSSSVSGAQRRLFHNEQLLVPPQAENQYLNVLAEQGIFGVLAFVFFALILVRTMYRCSRLPDPAARAVGLGGGAAAITLGLQGLLDANFLGEVSFPLFALLAVAALFVAFAARDGEAPGVPVTNRRSGS